jgi:hypothetical protein
MRPAPKPAKKYLAGSSLRQPDTNPAPAPKPAAPSTERTTPISMTPGAVRKREERAKRANARQYARDAASTQHTREAHEKEPHVFMPGDDVARKDARQMKEERYGGRRVTPKGTGGTFNNPDDTRAQDATDFRPLNRNENQPSPRAKVTFIPLGMGGSKDWTQGTLEKILTALNRKQAANIGDRKRIILDDIGSVLFEKQGDEVACRACDYVGHRPLVHLESAIEDEYFTYNAAMQRHAEMVDGYKRLAMSTGTTSIPVESVVPGVHYRLFNEQAIAHTRRARKQRTA